VFLQTKGEKMMQGIFVTGGHSTRHFTPDEKRVAMEMFTKDLGEVLRDIHSREYFLPNPNDDRVCGWCPFRLPCGNL
jgi:hypothetical protein